MKRRAFLRLASLAPAGLALAGLGLAGAGQPVRWVEPTIRWVEGVAPSPPAGITLTRREGAAFEGRPCYFVSWDEAVEGI